MRILSLVSEMEKSRVEIKVYNIANLGF